MSASIEDRLRHFGGGGTVENPVALIREAVEEIELLRSVQGLSVSIPEYGEWGSETLGYLFLDLGIQPGDGYEQASARHGDLLRENENLRGDLQMIKDLHKSSQEPGGPLRCKECRQHWPCATAKLTHSEAELVR